MGRTVHGRGGTLQEALDAAVRDLLDTDEVEVRLEGDQVDGWTGVARIDIEVTAVSDPADDAEDDGGDDASEEDAAADDVSEEVAAVEASEDEDEQVSSDEPPLVSAQDLDEEADAAADFLEGLLDAMDLPGDLRIKLHEDHAELEVIDIGSGALIGRRGQTLDAIQELVRCSLQRQFQRRARVKIDAEGYRSRRLEKLVEKADEAIDAVLDTGEAERLEPMDVFERKAIHQMVAEVDGLTSRSQGREPARRVIIEQE
ncbi:MAG: KH domain-containing protein [Nitriliruptor sp.]|nr:MAG: KH domain-containing protein [Nitriliruptor sp.]